MIQFSCERKINELKNTYKRSLIIRKFVATGKYKYYIDSYGRERISRKLNGQYTCPFYEEETKRYIKDNGIISVNGDTDFSKLEEEINLIYENSNNCIFLTRDFYKIEAEVASIESKLFDEYWMGKTIAADESYDFIWYLSQLNYNIESIERVSKITDLIGEGAINELNLILKRTGIPIGGLVFSSIKESSDENIYLRFCYRGNVIVVVVDLDKTIGAVIVNDNLLFECSDCDKLKQHCQRNIDRDELIRTVKKYGEIWEDKRRFKALLMDCCPKDKMFRNLLIGSLEECIPNQIMGNGLNKFKKNKCLKVLMDAYGCNEEKAEEVILFWIELLSKEIEK